MTKLLWDQVGERVYETGVDHGVLYLPNQVGEYDMGVAWNGLVTVTQAPTGAEATPMYADNIKYLNLQSVEEFGATIEAFTYPDEWGVCDGTAQPEPGIFFGQQPRRSFGLCYRSLIGNDVEATEYGYKLHLIYGGLASPSEKAHTTVNDSPEAITFSWELTTTAVAVGTINGVDYKPLALLTLDSTKVDSVALAALEAILFGTPGSDPRLPLPGEVVALFSGTTTEIQALAAPVFNSATETITIPAVTGVVWKINGAVKAPGPVVITEDTIVDAVPAPGYRFAPNVDTDFGFDYTP